MRAGFGEALSRAACFSEDSLWREDGCAGDEVGGRFIRRRENGRDLDDFPHSSKTAQMWGSFSKVC